MAIIAETTMTMLFHTLAVAFAAFCVWLGVRIINRRERWAKRTLMAAVGLPVLYGLSFGPACWWFSTPSSRQFEALERCGVDVPCAPRQYWPIGWLAKEMPGPIRDAISWYATRRECLVTLPASPNYESCHVALDL
jgi:hypothetical protein